MSLTYATMHVLAITQATYDLWHVDNGPQLVGPCHAFSQRSGNAMQLLLHNMRQHAWQASIRVLELIQRLAHSLDSTETGKIKLSK